MGWWKTAQKGDKLVCIERPPAKDVEFLTGIGMSLPAVGEVVTCDEIEVYDPEDPKFCSLEYPAFELGFCRIWLACEFFKPAETRSIQKGMEILKSLLNPTTKDLVRPEHEHG